MDEAREISTWAKDNPDEVKAQMVGMGAHQLVRAVMAGLRLQRRKYRAHLRSLQDVLADCDKDDGEDFGRIVARSPEVYFYLRVVLPCVCIYQTAPGLLLRRVQHGNLAAIEAMMRLDDRAQHLPAIIEWRDSVAGAARIERVRRMSHWTDQGLDRGQFSLSQVKVSIAGLILAIIDKVGKYWNLRKRGIHDPKVNPSHLLELFHAIERDRRNRFDGVYDDDIVDMHLDSWRKMVGRQRRAWGYLLEMKPRPKFGGF